MDTSLHDLSTLFDQLGLENSPEQIQDFVRQHKISAGTALADAPFWNSAQASFLREGWRADSDWSDVIDELNTLLH
ncbi:DUF2789 domain-containing protein [Alishewanella sp. BS5-314]|uniref:DUF2789 domain-containing protein n=1 Tax=Alishewanella sp. BS5-314 TaxID=2755587 RepID=UPI0021BB655B|nr:DUF2789 domain-containing protein [Alishewanella sp. BS5-314]MCT8126834.1 DUF2789 domain-containing protein [Alishewanella sp. BS5-314]